jgi:ubiquitin carboxyl-terminal hydrolase 25/28
MISARGPNISPEPQLARLTICPATQDLNQRRSSSVSTTRPLLNQPNELSPQKAVATAINIDATIPEGNEEAQVSPASDGTLVGDERRDMSQNPDYMVVDTSEGKKQTEALEDKENMPPTETAPSARSTNPENATQPLAPSSPSRVNEQPTSAPPQTEPNHKTNVLGDATDSSSSAGAPNRAPPVPPRSQEKDAVKQAEEYARQQDVTEVIGNVLFQLQCAIRPLGFDTDGQQQDEIKNLFFGMLKTTTTNSRGQARNKEEYFSDLMINVHSGPSDIYSAIDKALDRQIVTVDGSAETQFATISRLPPILQVYINRTDFDLKTSMPVKVTNHLDFPPEIYMDRFMDTDEADLLARRQQTWTYKDQLRQIETEIAALEKTKFEISQSEVFDTLAGQLMVIAECDEETDPAVYARMSAQSKQVAVNMREDLAKLRERAAELREIISSTYSDLKSIPYHLAAVFIHRGAASSGHYWIYIHDFQNDLWREYNDETVRVVGEPATTIFAAPPATERRPATPNYLVYVKAGMEQQLVQALRREPQQMLAEDAMQGVEQHPATDVPAWKDFDESWRGQSLIDDRGPTPEF